MSHQVAQKKFDKLSRSIAADFLQTVLVVDDKARTPDDKESKSSKSDTTPKPGALTTPPGLRRRSAPSTPAKDDSTQALPEATPSDTAKAPTEKDDEVLPIKGLNQSFAEKGIVCGFLSPASTGVDREPIIKAAEKSARRADIIILDWKMEEGDEKGRDDGYTALRIIKNILTNDEGKDDDYQSNGRLRLISIYSQSNDLSAIMDIVEEMLKGMNLPTPFDRKDPFTLLQDSTRICAFKKAGGITLDESDPLHTRTYEVEKLTDRLIDEFTELTKGLLSNVAIAALSSLRANTHKILQKFNSHLDAPYLTHRALTNPPEETQNHPIALIASEMQDVLEGNDVKKTISDEHIELWVRSLPHGADNNSLGITPKDLPNLLVETIIKGVNNKCETPQWTSFVNQVKKRGGGSKLTDLLRNDADGIQKDKEFSILTTIRSHYNAPPPYMTLGTIIAEHSEAATRYYVCIQPVCDCVRLKTARRFPFLKLQSPGEDKLFDLVIKDQSSFIELKVNYKPHEIEVFKFEPKKGLIEAEPREKNWIFDGEDAAGKKISYHWVADLKFAHAQRIAENFGGQISRVGLNESEWLRRMATKE